MPKSVSAFHFVVRYPFALLLLLVNHIIPALGNQGENFQTGDPSNPSFTGPANPSNSSGSGLAMTGDAAPRDELNLPVPDGVPSNAAVHPFVMDMNSTDLAVPPSLDPLEVDPLGNEPPYDEDAPEPFDAF